MSELTKPNEKLLEYYFEMKQPLSQRTKDKYTNYFKKFQLLMREYKISPPTIDGNIPQLITISKEQFENGTIKAEVIKQFFQLLRPLVSSDKNAIIETINIYSKNTMKHYKNKTKDELNDTSVTYKQLISLLKDKRVTDIDYILFYILINYGVRNLDLIINLQEQNDDENYMLVNAKSIRYVRNNYKTFNQYGTKKISIKNPRFVSIIKRLVGEKKQYLFGKYDETNMSNYINTRFNHYLKTDNRVGEGLIYKLVLQHYSCKNDTKKLISLADSRPHSIAVQTECYE